MRPFLVQFYKNPDLLHWGFEGVRLGEDLHGLWVGLPVGSRRCRAGVERSPTAAPAVQCFPHRGWWTLHYNGVATELSHFVDITTQPRWDEHRVEMVDLDLDVVRHQSGVVVVEDEDEFEVNRIRYRYSAEMVDRARAETEVIRAGLEDRVEPFFSVAEGWLARVS